MAKNSRRILYQYNSIVGLFSTGTGFDLTPDMLKDVVGFEPTENVDIFDRGDVSGKVFAWPNGLHIVTRRQSVDSTRFETKSVVPNSIDYSDLAGTFAKALPHLGGTAPISIGINSGAIVLGVDGILPPLLDELTESGGVRRLVGSSPKQPVAQMTLQVPLFRIGQLTLVISNAALQADTPLPGVSITTNCSFQTRDLDQLKEYLGATHLSKTKKRVDSIIRKTTKVASK